jgi:hypothetical protein
MRSRFSVLVVGVLGSGAAAHAEQWKATLDRVTVDPKKADGRPWDADDSAPDVKGQFAVGVIKDGHCITAASESIAKHQDTADFAPQLAVVFEGEEKTACMVVNLTDADLVEDDTIGREAGALSPGQHRYRVGQANIQVTFASTANITIAPTPEAAAAEGANNNQTPQPVRQPNAVIYKISLVTARIHPTRADGVQWDEARDTAAEDQMFAASLVKLGLAVVSTGGIGLLAVGPSVVEAKTQKVSGTHVAQTVSAPDPFVVLRWGNTSFTTPVNQNTEQPRWDFAIVVPQEVAEKKPLRIEVFDQDGGANEPIGSDSISSKDLLATDVFRKSFGGVDEIVLEVEKTAEVSQPVEASVKVDTTKGWANTGVDVLAGQTIVISTTGQYCIKGKCSDADGDQTVLVDASTSAQGATAPIHNGQLAAVIGDDFYPIGKAATIVARASGRLLLGVANKGSSGTLSTKIQLYYPLQ